MTQPSNGMPSRALLPGSAVRRLALTAWLLAAPIVAAHGADAAEAADTVHANGSSHRTVTIVIEAMKFAPATVEVRQGDTVVWRNKDPFPHTVRAQRPGGFSSPEIAAGNAWKFVAREKGVFPYICTLHATMQSTLIVK
ncbi:MAG TPA: cupredoxin domain-containing protein [Herbaspirillum sp.]|jgi:plastocyanin